MTGSWSTLSWRVHVGRDTRCLDIMLLCFSPPPPVFCKVFFCFFCFLGFFCFWCGVLAKGGPLACDMNALVGVVGTRTPFCWESRFRVAVGLRGALRAGVSIILMSIDQFRTLLSVFFGRAPDRSPSSLSSHIRWEKATKDRLLHVCLCSYNLYF